MVPSRASVSAVKGLRLLIGIVRSPLSRIGSLRSHSGYYCVPRAPLLAPFKLPGLKKKRTNCLRNKEILPGSPACAVRELFFEKPFHLEETIIAAATLVGCFVLSFFLVPRDLSFTWGKVN